MKVARVLSLRVGDLVADSAGAIGTVVGFHRDHVSIVWGGLEAVTRYADDELRAHGVVRVEGQ